MLTYEEIISMEEAEDDSYTDDEEEVDMDGEGEDEDEDDM